MSTPQPDETPPLPTHPSDLRLWWSRTERAVYRTYSDTESVFKAVEMVAQWKLPRDVVPLVVATDSVGTATPADPGDTSCPWCDASKRLCEALHDRNCCEHCVGDMHEGTPPGLMESVRAASRTPGEPDPRDVEIARLRAELAEFHDFLRPRVDPDTPVEPDDPEGMRRRRDELIDRLIAERAGAAQRQEIVRQSPTDSTRTTSPAGEFDWFHTEAPTAGGDR